MTTADIATKQLQNTTIELQEEINASDHNTSGSTNHKNTDTNDHKDKEQWKDDQYLINSTKCKRNVVDIDCETNGASDD